MHVALYMHTYIDTCILMCVCIVLYVCVCVYMCVCYIESSHVVSSGLSGFIFVLHILGQVEQKLG